MSIVDEHFNQTVGRNVQQLRKAAGLSQAELADRLSQGGKSFQQQTILKVEKGSRPLKLDEAVAIASALDVFPDLLWKGARIVDTAAALLSDKERVEAAARALELATIDFEEAKGSLSSWMNFHQLGEAMGWPNSVAVTDFLDRAEDLAAMETLRVVEQALERHRLKEAVAEVGSRADGGEVGDGQHPKA